MERSSSFTPLAEEHGVQAFACGDPDIDRFLHEQAAAEQSLKLSQVCVTTGSTKEVRAYFTLSPLAVRVEPALLTALGVGGIPYPSIGGFLLGRLGVHRQLQGRGIGEAMVMRAAQTAKWEAEIVGGVFLAVDPRTERLAEWYSKQEFSRLGERTRRMILPLHRVP